MKKEDLTVYAPGTEVTISQGLIKGTIIDISITGNFKVQYNVIWWDGNDRKSAWMDTCEIQAGKPVKLKIGFAQENE